MKFTSVAALASLMSTIAPAVVMAQGTVAADAIYVGGDIVTIDEAHPTVEAVAIKDGKILALGDRATIEAQNKGSETRIVDLAGKTLLPGFLDAHSHYISSLSVANQVNAPPVGPGSEPDAIVAELVKFRETNNIPKGEVIQAYGYDENVMPVGRQLNRDDLDKALPDNPVLVGHVSMHGAVMNSAALDKWNITSETQTPPGGVIVRKEGTNEPYGLIMETAYLPVFASLPKPTREQEIEWSRAGQMLYAKGASRPPMRARHTPTRSQSCGVPVTPAPISSTSSLIPSSPTSTRFSKPTRSMDGGPTRTISRSAA